MISSGSVLPCPHMRDQKLGSIADPHVVDSIFETRTVDGYWDLCLSKIDGCTDCAYRLGCTDCRSADMHISGNLHEKTLCAMAMHSDTERRA